MLESIVPLRWLWIKLNLNPFLPTKHYKCGGRFSLLVGYKIQPRSISTNQNAALMIGHYYQLDFTKSRQPQNSCCQSSHAYQQTQTLVTSVLLLSSEKRDRNLVFVLKINFNERTEKRRHEVIAIPIHVIHSFKNRGAHSTEVNSANIQIVRFPLQST